MMICARLYIWRYEMPESSEREEIKRIILELPFTNQENVLYMQGLGSLSDSETRELLADLKSSFANTQPALELAREILMVCTVKALLEECDCICHTNLEVRHVMACCTRCGYCRKNIKTIHIVGHEEACTYNVEPHHNID